MSSKTLTLQIDPRSTSGSSSSRRLRRAGQIPAVVYGHGGPGIPVTVKGSDLGAVLHHPGLVNLEIDGSGSKSAIVKDIQHDPINDTVLHIDFQEVKANEVITSHAVIEPVGTPAGAIHGGQLEQALHELEIRCLPGDMIETLEVDVSALEVDEALHVAQLVLPEGIEVTAAADTLVFQVRVPRVAESDDEGEEGEEAEGGEEGAAAEGGEE